MPTFTISMKSLARGPIQIGGDTPTENTMELKKSMPSSANDTELQHKNFCVSERLRVLVQEAFSQIPQDSQQQILKRLAYIRETERVKIAACCADFALLKKGRTSIWPIGLNSIALLKMSPSEARKQIAHEFAHLALGHTAPGWQIEADVDDKLKEWGF